MKTLIIFFILIQATTLIYAQEKVDKFCEVVIKQQTFGSNYKVDRIEYGKKNNFVTYKDRAVGQALDSMLNFKPFPSSILIMDYMSQNHWTLISSYSVVANSTANSNFTHFIFKREFDSSEYSNLY